MVRDANPGNKNLVIRAWPRSRDLLFKFWDPIIYPEGLMMQTSTFACRLKVRDNKPEYEKWVKWRRGLCHVAYYSNFAPPPNISGMAEDTNLKFCMRTESKGY